MLRKAGNDHINYQSFTTSCTNWGRKIDHHFPNVPNVTCDIGSITTFPAVFSFAIYHSAICVDSTVVKGISYISSEMSWKFACPAAQAQQR